MEQTYTPARKGKVPSRVPHTTIVSACSAIRRGEVLGGLQVLTENEVRDVK